MFSIIMYNVALSDTITFAVENNELVELVAKNQDAPKEIQAIQKKLIQIQQIVGNDVTVNMDIHQVLLEAVTQYVQENELVLKDFPQPYLITDKGYITKTAKVTVEGDFIRLLKLIYFLESDYNVGKVVAVDFKTTKELRTRKRKLNTIIYLQNVKTQTDEENS